MDTAGRGVNADQDFSEKLHPFQWKSNLPNHGNSNRPRCIANRETEIRVIGSLVLTLLHIMYNLCQTCQHVIRKGLKRSNDE
jgi:hypothetical protein